MTHRSGLEYCTILACGHFPNFKQCLEIIKIEMLSFCKVFKSLSIEGFYYKEVIGIFINKLGQIVII